MSNANLLVFVEEGTQNLYNIHPSFFNILIAHGSLILLFDLADKPPSHIPRSTLLKVNWLGKRYLGMVKHLCPFPFA